MLEQVYPAACDELSPAYGGRRIPEYSGRKNGNPSGVIIVGVTPKTGQASNAPTKLSHHQSAFLIRTSYFALRTSHFVIRIIFRWGRGASVLRTSL